jgi:hypothetical protein
MVGMAIQKKARVCHKREGSGEGRKVALMQYWSREAKDCQPPPEAGRAAGNMERMLV